MTPRVTVLLPVYRGAADLGAAIESVLEQTFADFELLVVDDASPDDSVAVVESYGDPRIRLLRNERNLGQVAALNRGLAEARGGYVARLDQDDRCLPERLARQVAVLDAEPRVALVGTWMTIVDEDGNRLGRLDGRLDDYVDFVAACLMGPLPIGHPAAMFRRDVAIALGGYDLPLPLAEDRDLWRRMALAGHQARIVTQPLVVYRAHAGSQSQQRAELQDESEARSVERFISALSVRVPADRIARMLGEDASWASPTRAETEELAASLETLLVDAAATLRLAPEQEAKLRRLVRTRVGWNARRSWRAGARVHWRVSRPLRRFAGNDAPAAAGAAAVYVLAPLLRILHSAKWVVLDLAGTPGRLERPKRLARRMSTLTVLYGRLRGGR